MTISTSSLVDMFSLAGARCTDVSKHVQYLRSLDVVGTALEGIVRLGVGLGVVAHHGGEVVGCCGSLECLRGRLHDFCVHGRTVVCNVTTVLPVF